jgi:uncharacterized membrane protein YqjE
MVEIKSGPGADSAPGLWHGLKTALAVLSSMLHTRFDLFVTELEEERERLRQTLVLTLLLIFGLSLGLILLTIFIVALFWDKGWIAAIGCQSAVYIGIGVTAGVKLRSNFLNRPRLFPSMLEVLAQDRDRLRAPTRE